MMSENIGKLLFAGFEGYELTPLSQAENLIKIHKVHSFLLGSKSFKSVPQLRNLIQSLQNLAKSENYETPLIIAVDQELGCCNSIYDDTFLTQFPGAMGLAATDNLELIYQVGKAVALELRSIGFNLYMGPVLDICSKISTQLIGVRSFGSTVEEVTKYAGIFTKGLKDGGILTCAKHFPGMGSAFIDNLIEIPMTLETVSQLECFNILPFQNLIDQGLIDSVYAGSVAVPNVSSEEIHACLSPVVIQELLRKKLMYDGLVISECLELEALSRNFGLGQATALAIVYAGCDMVMICNDYNYQKEALEFLSKAFEDENFELTLLTCLRRIDNLLNKLSWKDKDVVITDELRLKHHQLSSQAYAQSITLVRDYEEVLPINTFFRKNEYYLLAKNLNNRNNDDLKVDNCDSQNKKTKYGNKITNTVLLLTPLITPIHPTIHIEPLLEHNRYSNKQNLFPGEELFQKFGENLANYDKSIDYKVLHTSYTANGVTSLHESMIESAAMIILVCADVSRNTYQIGVAKHLSALCGNYRNIPDLIRKPLIIISVASPYDFLYHSTIGSTYLCTYDYTPNVFRNLPAVLFGDLNPKGKIPGESDKLSTREEVMMDLSPSYGSKSWYNLLLNKTPHKVIDDIESVGDNDLTNINVKDSSNIVDPMLNQSSSLAHLDSQLLMNSEKVEETNDHDNGRKHNKTWVVEKFDINRDLSSLFTLVKNSTIPDISEPIDVSLASRFRNLVIETGDSQQHFIIRNPTLNILYGAIFTQVDVLTKCGRIVFMVVSKSKRRQSVGEILHRHAIRYLTIERGCTTIALGSAFPLFNFLAPKVLDDISTIWYYLETEDDSNISMATSSLQLVGFFRYLGWNNTRHNSGTFQQVRKYLLYLDTNYWQIPEGVYAKLTNLNVRFEISNTVDSVFNLLAKNQIEDEEEIRFPELYGKVAKYLIQESQDNAKRKTIVLYLLDNNNSNAIIGSAVIYSSRSKLANFYALIDNVSSSADEIIYGITGLLIDDRYKDFKNDFKMGLICASVEIIKKLGIQKLLLHNCMKMELGLLKDSGFEVYREYCACFGKKNSYEWVI